MLNSLSNLFRPAPVKHAEPSLFDQVMDTAEFVLQTEFDRKDGYFYTSVSQQERDELKATTLEIVRGLFVDGDPVAALRLRLVNYVIEIGDLLVLSTTSEYAMFKGISGELRTRVAELSLIDEQVSQKLDDLGVLSATQAEMVNALNSRVHFLNLPFLVFGTTRIVLGDSDTDPTKDWFRPLCIAYQIHAEDTYRMKLDMPTVLENQLEAIAYSALPGLVLDGYKNPREEWETRWVAVFNKPSPFDGIAP